MINTHPTICNVCGGKVILTSNSNVYLDGIEKGSGRCYLCTECGAMVGTHKNNPTEAMGILSDEETRRMRKKCHEVFDRVWRYKAKGTQSDKMLRSQTYARLAQDLRIPVQDCHFGYFDMKMLEKAYTILKTWDDNGGVTPRGLGGLD